MIGVYILIKDFDVIYIGQSYNMELRVLNHEIQDYDFYSLHQCDNLKESETYFIKLIRPLLNVHHNVDQERIFVSFESDEDFKKHLEAKAKENKKSVSSYIRAALKKISRYKEELV